MLNKRNWELLSAIFLLIVLTALYGVDKKHSSSTVKTIDKENIISKKLTLKKTQLLEKLNYLPEYANLTAWEKVKVIVKEMRNEQPLITTKKRVKTKSQLRRGIQIENRIKIKIKQR